MYERLSKPRKTSLNWFIPAFVNSSVGSSPGTTGLEATTVWPFPSKNFRNVERISAAFIGRDVARRRGPARGARPSRNGRRWGRRPGRTVLGRRAAAAMRSGFVVRGDPPRTRRVLDRRRAGGAQRRRHRRERQGAAEQPL